MTRTDPRNNAAWRRLTADLKRTTSNCHLCGLWIDPTRCGRTDPLAFTADHLIPLARGGELLDPGNLAPAHRTCNSRRNDRPLTEAVYAECRAAMRQPATAPASRAW